MHMTTNASAAQDFRSFVWGRLVLILLVALLASCGGGDAGDDGEIDDPDQEGAGWITLTYPDTGGAYTTTAPTVTLYGEAFVSPTWWVCCTGNATDTGVTVTWTNSTSGTSGSAFQRVTYSCFLSSCWISKHTWQATIDLVVGDNLIAVTATDPSGNLDRVRITVTRTPDSVPPTVLSTTPTDGETGVSTTSGLEIRFSESMAPSSLNASTILLTDSSHNAVMGSVGYSGGVATFKPAVDLSVATVYTATVTTGVKDIAGNALASPYVWTFTSSQTADHTPPSVSTTIPESGDTCAATETAVSASFDESVAYQTVNTSTFQLKDPLDNPVSGSVMLDYTGTARFWPASPFANSTAYTATLTTGITDLSGNHMASDYSWTFTTLSAGSGNWSSTTDAGAPSPRTGHTAAWTGSQMIIWGGTDGTAAFGDGARWNPASDDWSAVSTVGAPEPRSGHVAVWTGNRMIIWGGVRPGAYLGSGSRYDPATDSWSPMSSAGAPSPRASASAVWTGTEMIVWGGGNGSTLFGDGARYDPATDTWSPITASAAPSARSGHTAVWTGSAMIVWGGSSLGPKLDSGGLYTPASNSWVPLPLTSAPTARNAHTAVWTGPDMVVWGGLDAAGSPLAAGARFNPSANAWQPLATLCQPLARYGHVAVWTGNEMLVWGGGEANGPHYAVGGRYQPGTGTWQSIPAIGAPSGRVGHSGVWDGNGLIVWGGRDALGATLNSGGRYKP
jgi:N-acetylneuraminic acid mutarotase